MAFFSRALVNSTKVVAGRRFASTTVASKPVIATSPTITIPKKRKIGAFRGG